MGIHLAPDIRLPEHCLAAETTTISEGSAISGISTATYGHTAQRPSHMDEIIGRPMEIRGARPTGPDVRHMSRSTAHHPRTGHWWARICRAGSLHRIAGVRILPPRSDVRQWEIARNPKFSDEKKSDGKKPNARKVAAKFYEDMRGERTQHSKAAGAEARLERQLLREKRPSATSVLIRRHERNSDAIANDRAGAKQRPNTARCTPNIGRAPPPKHPRNISNGAVRHWDIRYKGNRSRHARSSQWGEMGRLRNIRTCGKIETNENKTPETSEDPKQRKSIETVANGEPASATPQGRTSRDDRRRAVALAIRGDFESEV